MKVQELIAELQKQDAESIVAITDCQGDWREVDEVEARSIPVINVMTIERYDVMTSVNCVVLMG